MKRTSAKLHRIYYKTSAPKTNICLCNAVLACLSKEQSDRLEDANYYIRRTLFRTKNESHETLLSIVGMNILKHRRYYQALVLTYKCLNSIGPKYIAGFLNLRDICYKLSGKGSNLIQPHFNTEWMHKSSSLIACKLWNKLLLYIRNSDNLKEFKKAFHKFNLGSLY